jgi:hypothetical protein
MATLYIIGNGFDLWHGLPTSYNRFYEFAKDILDELEQYFYGGVEPDCLWYDFEESLGKFEWEMFYEEYDYADVSAEDFKLSDTYGIESDVSEQADNMVNEIRIRFHDWICNIDISKASKKLTFSSDSRFLTFNYTSTLQDVYGIGDDRVCHIHGKADRYDELVFGHGDTFEEEPDVDEHGESNCTIFSDAERAARYPFYAFQKPVERVIERNSDFFEPLHDITDVIVIGHSLNEIDLPYFEKVAKSAKRAKWTVSFHEHQEKVEHLKQLLKCGVPAEDILQCASSDLETIQSDKAYQSS